MIEGAIWILCGLVMLGTSLGAQRAKELADARLSAEEQMLKDNFRHAEAYRQRRELAQAQADLHREFLERCARAEYSPPSADGSLGNGETV
jgi:hypothetical protein